VLIYAIAGLGVLVLVGWAGQLTLGQWALVGVGAYASVRVASANGSLVLALLVGGGVAALISVIVGLPALRVRGMFLGVATMAFATFSQAWLFNRSFLSGVNSPTVYIPGARLPMIGSVGERGLYYITLIILILACGALQGLRRSGAALRIASVRDNARKAAASGVPSSSVALGAFALAGFLSGISGTLFAYSNQDFDITFFSPQVSFTLFALVVIGGLSSIGGPILGAVVVIGIPLIFHFGLIAIFLGSGALLLNVLLFAPDGLAGLWYWARDWFVREVARSLRTTALPSVRAQADSPLLSVEGIGVHFGGLVALDDVSLKVRPGEAVGVIGMNGAGKTTLLDCISGAVKPDKGKVLVKGVDVVPMAPAYRAYLGIGRTFQDGSVFRGLTVLESMLVSLEGGDYSGTLGGLTRAPWERWSQRRKEGMARRVLLDLGLSHREEVLVGELSTGERKLCDLATALVRQPELIVLDEPTAGLPHAEVEGVIEMLKRLRQEYGSALLLVEHDMNVVRAVTERAYVM